MSGALTLAVFHRSRDVVRLLAPLRRTGHLRVKCVQQTSARVVPRVPSNATGVLWELGADDDVDRRHLTRVLAGVPSASFGAGAQPIADLSRALGFRHHLRVPLRLAEVERALGLPGEHDLSERLAAGGDRLAVLANRADVIVDTMRVLNLSTDPAMVASTLSARVSEWLPMASWSVVAVEADGSVNFLASRPQDPALRGPAEAIADVVAQREQPFVSARLAGDARVGEHIEAAGLGWPIVAHGVIVGVLVGIDHGRARTSPRFSPAFRRSMARLIEPAGYALAHALRVARAEALSVTDDLTQLFNSRYLHEVLRKETKRALRSHAPLSLLFVDLDGFKRINDAHGHLLGSRALVEAAALIRGSARETDIVARYGGDEFSLVLPDTTPEGALAVANRLRDRISRHIFLADRGPGIRLTASIGVATMPEAADTADGLLEAADAAMYRVKEDGKDGIHMALRGGATTRGLHTVQQKSEDVR